MATPAAGTMQAVIFDLDGTIGDTMPILMQGLKDVAEAITGRQFTPEDVVDRYGPPDQDVLAQLIGVSRLSAAHEAQYRSHVRKLAAAVPPIEGMSEMLMSFHRADVQLGVYSARGRAYASEIVQALGVAHFMDDIMGGDDVEQVKPHPEGITKMLAAFDVEPERAAYVGDSDNDLVAARAAGVTSVLALWSSTPQPHLRDRADLVVSHTSELMDWVLGRA